MRKFADRLRDLELRVERLGSELEVNEEEDEEEESVSVEDLLEDDDEEALEGYVIACYKKAGSPANVKTLYLQSFDQKKKRAKWTGDKATARFFGREATAISFLEEYEIRPATSNHQKPRAGEC